MSAGRLMTAADFLAAAALGERDIPLPDGQSVRVRELSILQRAEFSRRTKEDSRAAGVWLVEQCCIDGQGFRMFADGDAGDLMLKSPRFVEHIAVSVMRLSGLLGGDSGGNA